MGRRQKAGAKGGKITTTGIKEEDQPRPLTQADRIEIFKLATASLPRCYADQIKTGMSDKELSNALEHVLGIFGGSCGPDRLSCTFTSSGLRIWGGWHIVNHVQEKPLFAGRTTIATAREVYNICDPNKKQLDLFLPFPCPFGRGVLH